MATRAMMTSRMTAVSAEVRINVTSTIFTIYDLLFFRLWWQKYNKNSALRERCW